MPAPDDRGDLAGGFFDGEDLTRPMLPVIYPIRGRSRLQSLLRSKQRAPGESPCGRVVTF
jgi:hypothetical protein